MQRDTLAGRISASALRRQLYLSALYEILQPENVLLVGYLRMDLGKCSDNFMSKATRLAVATELALI